MTKQHFTDYFCQMLKEYCEIAGWSVKVEDKLDYDLLTFQNKLHDTLTESFTTIICSIDEITD
jgi:hypothetical protein